MTQKINFHTLVWALRKKGMRNFEIADAAGVPRWLVSAISQGRQQKVEYNQGSILLDYAKNHLTKDEIYEQESAA